MAAVTDYLKLSAAQAREQFRDLLARRQVTSGKQGLFRPVETFLCLAAGLVVDRRRYGGGRSASSAPEPVQSLARLFSRPPSSVLEKMANLDGVRPHGALSDAAVGAELRSDVPRFARLYRLILNAARAEGIGPSRLPDFLGLEQGGELELLGQHELDRPSWRLPCEELTMAMTALTRRPCGRGWRRPGSDNTGSRSKC